VHLNQPPRDRVMANAHAKWICRASKVGLIVNVFIFEVFNLHTFQINIMLRAKHMREIDFCGDNEKRKCV
jgi:hypothetical protein